MLSRYVFMALALLLPTGLGAQSFPAADATIQRIWAAGMDSSHAYSLAQALMDSIGALFLDDTVYSSGSPMVLDLVFDDCLQATGVATRPHTGHPPLLSAVRPNPMRSDAAVAFSLPARAHATLIVLDVQGRVVRRLLDGVVPAGEHRVVWDGRTDQGRRAAAGVYFLRGLVGERVESRRVVLSR